MNKELRRDIRPILMQTNQLEKLSKVRLEMNNEYENNTKEQEKMREMLGFIDIIQSVNVNEKPIRNLLQDDYPEIGIEDLNRYKLQGKQQVEEQEKFGGLLHLSANVKGNLYITNKNTKI